jgi:hypothetical protein
MNDDFQVPPEKKRRTALDQVRPGWNNPPID